MTYKINLIILAVVMFNLNLIVAADEEDKMAEQLNPLKPFIGKTWKGAFSNSTPEKPMIDISRWERALNGQAVRILHSVNNGEYGGETIIVWDAKKEGLVFFYFTTAGFFTNGTMSFEDGKFISHEYVTGQQGWDYRGLSNW